MILLGHKLYKYNTTTNCIKVFGALFNDIEIFQGDRIVKVPLVYGDKEKWMSRLTEDPDILRAEGITLPRMSIKMTSLTHDTERQANRQGTVFTPAGLRKRYIGVPYEISIELGVWARTEDDAHQIIEQILPFFVPDYTIRMRVGDKTFRKIDKVPIILTGVSPEKESEGNMGDEIRVIKWGLEFIMKANYYGPTTASVPIRYIKANFQLDGSEEEAPTPDRDVYELASWENVDPEDSVIPEAGKMTIVVDDEDVVIRINVEDNEGNSQEEDLSDLMFGWDLRINNDISIEMKDIEEKDDYYQIEGVVILGDINKLKYGTSYAVEYIKQLVVELNEV